jgi:hypothetical protein
MEPVKAFTIDRKTWLHGEACGSYLYRRLDQKQCCLGFYLRAQGFTEDQIKGIKSPIGLMDNDRCQITDLPTWMIRPNLSHWHSEICAKLMITNDREDLSNEQREQLIIEGFAEQGIRVTFVGEY